MGIIDDLTQIPKELYDKRYIADSLYYDNAKKYRNKVKFHKKLSSKKNLIDWYIDKLEIDNSFVLDIGCGHGNFLVPIAEKLKILSDSSYILGVDISTACVNIANKKLIDQKLPGKVFLGDMESLRLPSNIFDKTLCNFTLYHAEEIQKAIDEIARVTNNKGLVYIVTNSRHAMKEFEQLNSTALSLTIEKDVPIATRLESRFCEENASEFFEGKLSLKKKYIFKDTMSFTSTKDFVSYYNITKGRYKSILSESLYLKLQKNVRRLVDQEIERNGAFAINKRSCLFILRTHS